MSVELFNQQIIMFHSNENTGSSTPFPKDGKFGLLTLQAIASNLTEKQLELLFQIDCSGSMCDICSDGRTKMQHILHTLKNMIMFLKENPSLKVNITIHAFDNKIFKIVERTKVNDETCAKILEAIETIFPRDSTNIENALNDVSEYFICTDLPDDCENISIFMTDGQATAGKNSHSELCKYVNNRITNVFIGFGIDHDAKLLKKFSREEESSYYFIDKLENAGLVYGEILHGFIYKFLEKVEIKVINGLIYDYKTNTWVTSLYIGNIVSESSKFYQLTSSTPSECVVTVSGYKVSDNSNFTTTVPIQEEQVDLTKYIYRQRTQELLFKINEFNNKDYNSYNPADYKLKQTDKKILNTKMREFFNELKKYMTENYLQEDILLKNLCDDIYICDRTIGTKFGYMFCASRECSQGQQRAYTATHVPEEEDNWMRPPPIGLQRQNAIFINSIDEYVDEYVDNNDLMFMPPPQLHHHTSGSTQTPYHTQTMTNIMRSCSAGTNTEDFEIEEK